MDILWDEAKKKALKETRDISIEDAAQLIVDGKYLAILENPGRPEQKIFIIDYRDYTHVVPFVIDKENNIVLKTVFPSRRYHKLYGAKAP